HIKDCRHEAHSGGLGEDHAGDKDGEREGESDGAESLSSGRGAKVVKAEGFELRGDDERKRGERDDQRLEDGHALEDVDVWAETEEEDAERAGERCGAGMKC